MKQRVRGGASFGLGLKIAAPSRWSRTRRVCFAGMRSDGTMWSDPIVFDVWERLAADRRQALEDDLAWIHP